MSKKKKKGQLKAVYHNIKRILGLVHENFSIGKIMIFIGIAAGLLATASSIFFGRLLDIAKSGAMTPLIQTAIILFAMGLAETALEYFNTYFSGKYRIRCGRTLRRTACRKVNNLSISYYENNHTGSTVSTLISDIDKLENFFITFAEDICSYLPTRIIMGLAVCLVLNYKLTLICLVATPLLGYIVGKITLRLKKSTNTIQEETENYNSLLRDFIGGIHIYKAYNMEDTFDEKIEDACEEVAKQSYIVSKIKNMEYGIQVLAHLIPSIIAYIVGGIFIFRGELTVGGFFIFTRVFFRVTGSFARLSSSWATIVETAGISQHLFKLLDAEEERKDGNNYCGDDFTLEFRNVSFSYNEGIDVLKDISFSVKKGEKVAIVGASGSGKTTIHKLIAGHYDHYSGAILINGEELSQWDLEKLRCLLSPVTQEVGLFDDTIRNNILHGRLDAGKEEIISATKKSYADEFIESMDMGLDTIIGEGGSKLSGGQRQRIALARTILKDAPVLLLDEPTSALDTKSEHYIQQAIEEMGKDKTVIIIAHRLSTIVNADKIIVLDRGKITEIGKHKELIKKNGKYTELYQRQLVEEVEEHS
ncbi:MAG: ABC transporter ATP-binding protein [Clostridiales bacterium]|nr:ABC transporter ATP-binding protein [Clostridiales bacterium]